MCVSFTDSKDNLMDFDGNVITCSTEDYEEVNTKPKKHEFHRLHIVEESFDIREFCYKEWHLKDVLYVPVDNGYGKEDVAFRVEHISDDKVYFVAVDAVGRSNMKDMNNFLDDYLKNMPEDLVRNMCEIEHKVVGNLVRRSKLTLLSKGNISDTNVCCNGVDDILFDGLLTEAERCKNFDGEDVFVTYQDKDDPDKRYIAITSYKERFLGTISIGKQWIPPFEYFNKNYEVVAWMPMFDEYKGE